MHIINQHPEWQDHKLDPHCLKYVNKIVMGVFKQANQNSSIPPDTSLELGKIKSNEIVQKKLDALTLVKYICKHNQLHSSYRTTDGSTHDYNILNQLINTIHNSKQKNLVISSIGQYYSQTKSMLQKEFNESGQYKLLTIDHLWTDH